MDYERMYARIMSNSFSLWSLNFTRIQNWWRCDFAALRRATICGERETVPLRRYIFLHASYIFYLYASAHQFSCLPVHGSQPQPARRRTNGRVIWSYRVQSLCPNLSARNKIVLLRPVTFSLFRASSYNNTNNSNHQTIEFTEKFAINRFSRSPSNPMLIHYISQQLNCAK